MGAFEAGEGVAAGDQGQRAPRGGQQGPDLFLVGGVVEEEEHPPVLDHGPEQVGPAPGVLRNGGLGDPARAQQRPQDLARLGRVRPRAAQVHGEPPVRVAVREGVRRPYREGRLAQPRLARDQDHRRDPGVGVLGQRPQPVEVRLPGGEVPYVARQSQPGLRQGGLLRSGPARGGGPLQRLRLGPGGRERRHQGGHRTALRAPGPSALHVGQRPHAHPGPVRELFPAEPGTPPQDAQQRGELSAGGVGGAHGAGLPGEMGWTRWRRHRRTVRQK